MRFVETLLWVLPQLNANSHLAVRFTRWQFRDQLWKEQTRCQVQGTRPHLFCPFFPLPKGQPLKKKKNTDELGTVGWLYSEFRTRQDLGCYPKPLVSEMVKYQKVVAELQLNLQYKKKSKVQMHTEPLKLAIFVFVLDLFLLSF